MIPAKECTLQNGFVTHAVHDPVKADIVGLMRDLASGLSPTGQFPGPNPCSLEKADFKMLRQGSYWLCEKTDGMRAMLFVTTYQGTKAAFLITRSWDVYVVGVKHMPRALFQGSLLDGELVCISNVWTWQGFDGIIVAGIPVWGLPLSKRINACQRSLKAYKPSPSDPLALRFKPYFTTMDSYMAHKQTSDNPSDGTIITPEELPVVVGRHRALFKLKDAGKHTVDFEIGADGALCVWCPKRNAAVPVGKLVKSPFDEPPAVGSIVEAIWRQKEYWNLVIVRTDKTTSNDMLTYTKTMTNIRENLKVQDLRAVFT